MKSKSIYFFELNDNKEIINFEKLRFLKEENVAINNSKIYLFLEDTISIGVIELN